MNKIIPQLNGLRAVAVGGVLLSHFYPRLFAGHLLSAGYYGVQLFFVLSGFLITRILLDCRTRIANGETTFAHALKAFYARRALRLLPALWVTLLISAAFLPDVREGVFWHLAYASNLYFFALGGLTSHLSHLWTLAVEEQFYLVWPLIVLLVPRRRLGPIIVGLIIAAPILRFLTVALYSSEVGRLPTWNNADALGIGAFIALSVHAAHDGEATLARFRYWGLLAGAVLLYMVRTPLANDRAWHAVIEGVGVSVFSAGLIAGAALGFTGNLGRFLSAAPVQHVGRISYGIYLLHMPILGLWGRFAPAWMPQHAGWGPEVMEQPAVSFEALAYFLIATSLTYLAALASWALIEEPALRLKDRVRYAPAPAPLPSMPAPLRSSDPAAR